MAEGRPDCDDMRYESLDHSHPGEHADPSLLFVMICGGAGQAAESDISAPHG
jgi:hypothetical protein